MINEKYKVPGLMVFFLITSSQVGVGILGFQSVINEYAGRDAWLSLIIAGLGVNVIIWLMYTMLNNDEYGDFYAMHQLAFGKWLGSFLTILLAIYLFLMAIVVFVTYIEVIRVWMFPHVKRWALLLAFIPLIYYTISHEFRTVVGVCFLGVVYPSLLMFSLIFPLEYGSIRHILPIMDHSVVELLQSSSLAILNFVGISTLLVYYPFIKKSKKSQKYAHYGNIYTTGIYLLICIVTYVYYTQSELDKTIWPTLGLWKVIELPFMARFEYFGIATLYFSTLPNLVLYTWATTRVLHRVFGNAHKKLALGVLLCLFAVSVFIEGREMVDMINNVIGRVGLIFLFVYIPVFCLIYFISRRVKRQ